MNQIYVIRHPETEWNKKGLIQGHQDSPLTAAGRQTARLVARKAARLDLTKIISSDLGRCRETAAIIRQETGATVKMVKALREMNYGRMNGQTVPEAASHFDLNDPQARAPRGESFSMMQKRVIRIVDGLFGKDQKPILIVTHEGPLRALFAAGRLTPHTAKKYSTSARAVYRLKPSGRGMFVLQAVQ